MSFRSLARLFVLVSLFMLGIPTAAPAGTAEWRVDMRNHLFIPDELNVTTGDSITWVNVEDHADVHTVDSRDPGGPLASPSIEQGEAFTFTFTAPGNYPYFCKVHGFDMSGTVRVRDPGVPFAVEDTLVLPHTPGRAGGTVNVVDNDVDPEDDPLSLVTWDETSARGGAVQCESNGDCTYTQPENQMCGFEDSFTYQISDGSNTDTGTVGVEVMCLPEAGTSIDWKLRRHVVARGRLRSTAPECFDSRRVKVQRRTRSGSWKTVAAGRTDAAGAFRVRLRDKAGVYRAVAPRVLLPSGRPCGRATSVTRRHRH